MRSVKGEKETSDLGGTQRENSMNAGTTETLLLLYRPLPDQDCVVDLLLLVRELPGLDALAEIRELVHPHAPRERRVAVARVLRARARSDGWTNERKRRRV